MIANPIAGSWLSVSGAKLYLNGSDSAIWIQLLLKILIPYSLFGGLLDKRSLKRVPIAGGNIIHAHTQNFMGNMVLVVDIRLQYFGVIRINGYAHAKIE